MTLNIREMINGGPSRLRYVFRYSTCRVQHPESVAEHSYYVAFYCLLVARWCEETGLDEVQVDVRNLLQRALLHDLEEARSGDFPRPFKYSSPELKKLLEGASQKAFEQVIEPVTGKQSGVMQTHWGPSDFVTDEYICSWLDAKDGTFEGRILEFADFLAVLSFLMQEGYGNGNRSIAEHCSDMDLYFKKFEDGSYNFIRPLVDQAATIMREIWSAK